MADWLALLRVELENLDREALIEPIAELEPNDNVVGEASMELRRIHTLANQFKQNAARTLLEVQLARDGKTYQEMFKRFCELDTKAEILRGIFWAGVKDEHQLWDKESIGIRRGWQITWSSEKGERQQGLWEKFFGR